MVLICSILYEIKERKAEVEFLREIEGKVLSIEIKSDWVTQAKSLKVFADRYNPEYMTIMGTNNLHIDKENKIHRYPLYLASHFPFSHPPFLLAFLRIHPILQNINGIKKIGL